MKKVFFGLALIAASAFSVMAGNNSQNPQALRQFALLRQFAHLRMHVVKRMRRRLNVWMSNPDVRIKTLKGLTSPMTRKQKSQLSTKVCFLRKRSAKTRSSQKSRKTRFAR